MIHISIHFECIEISLLKLAFIFACKFCIALAVHGVFLWDSVRLLAVVCLLTNLPRPPGRVLIT